MEAGLETKDSCFNIHHKDENSVTFPLIYNNNQRYHHLQIILTYGCWSWFCSRVPVDFQHRWGVVLFQYMNKQFNISEEAAELYQN